MLRAPAPPPPHHPPSVPSAPAAGVRRALTLAETAPVLRRYQQDLQHAANEEWAADPKANVLAVLPTGGGKTVFFGAIVAGHAGPSCCIAHRQELVEQISMALARYGVRHRIIAPSKVIKAICARHVAELGVCYYDPNARAAVAGVDTLVKRADDYKHWLATVTLWVQDEAHHVLKTNKWGAAAELFVNARGLGVTATPCRADGMGLGRHADGLFDAMVVGPTMRQLIDWGYLTDYRIIGAETHIDLAQANIGKNGDYVLDRGKGKAAVRNSTLVGDVVATYQEYAAGKLGVCFASDVDTAADIAAKFRAAGVPAEMVDGTTPDDLRRSIIAKFRRRELLVLVNVDLFGEGFDLPAIEVVMMARPTVSFSLFAQQFGRALRPMISAEHMRVWDDYTPEQRREIIRQSNKPIAIIIDHVANVIQPQLGLPDARNDWTLDRKEKAPRAGGSDAMPMSYCTNRKCAKPYERWQSKCPHCGCKPVPAANSSRAPKEVDGNMFEFDPALLAAMRGQAAAILESNESFRTKQVQKLQGMPNGGILAMRHVKDHHEHRVAALNLLETMAWWAGEWRAKGHDDEEVFKRFWFTFGVDWLSAQGLDRAGMEKLEGRIAEKLTAASSSARVRHTA